MRKIDAAITNDNRDVTWGPLMIRSAVRAFLATLEDHSNGDENDQ